MRFGPETNPTQILSKMYHIRIALVNCSPILNMAAAIVLGG